jgi:arylsulfatase A-like enzyme/Flp pilus assembly protein TadD
LARPLRYTFILVLVALGATAAAVGGWRYARASAPVPGPIILISIDTLRADRLPIYGYDRVRTPAIDTLARDGVVFEHAYSHSPQTFPSHVAMLTGRLPFETGVRDDLPGLLKPNERLLAQMLRDRGYATAGIVSSGLLRRATGVAQGFDFFDDPLTIQQAAPEPTTASDSPRAASKDDAELMPGDRRRDGAESEAIAEHWLDAVGSTRVFLFLQLHDLQAPYLAAGQDAAASPASYDTQIAHVDDVLGRFVRYLKKHQLYDQSTIVLVSDHGEGLGDHGEQQHGLFLYDEDIHVPFVIKPAAGLGAGRRVADVVQIADIVPTVLDLAKAPAPRNLRGRSLKPVADGTGTLPEATVYSETRYGRHRFGWSELVSVRDARFQYIRAPRAELYDQQRDPHQRANLVDGEDRDKNATPGKRAEFESSLARLLGEPSTPTDGSTATNVATIDPKDRVEFVEAYRGALELVSSRQWPKAIEVFQKLTRDEPDSTDVWNQLARVAVLAERHEIALAAYRRVFDLDSSDPRPLLDAAGVSLDLRKLDDAEELVRSAVDTGSLDARSRVETHAILTRIALGRHDVEAAREHAAAARKADPSSVLPLYVDARLLYEDGNFADALTRLQKAGAALRKDSGASPLAGLHYLTAEALIWADRPAEAETQLLEELRDFPHNLDARAALATLYQSGGERDQAAEVVADLVRITPTPEGFALAARLWGAFGDQKQATAARTDARRLSASRRLAH